MERFLALAGVLVIAGATKIIADRMADKANQKVWDKYLSYADKVEQRGVLVNINCTMR